LTRTVPLVGARHIHRFLDFSQEDKVRKIKVNVEFYVVLSYFRSFIRCIYSMRIVIFPQLLGILDTVQNSANTAYT
jgi:hypothetical protein